MTGPDERSEPTVHLGVPRGAIDETVRLGAIDETVRLGAIDETVRLGAIDETVRLGAIDETVHLGATSETVHLGGDPTGWFDGTDRAAGLDATGSAVRTHSLPPGQPWTGYGEPAAAPRVGATPTTPGGVAGTGRGVPPSGPSGPGGEVRFGPGVPATPPVPPAWPAWPPPRRRPLWRRVVSALSALLTAVLVAVVGFWLWQRLAPLEITGVTVAVPRPAGQRCDVTVDVVATVRTNGRAGVIEYRWQRSGAPPGALLTERVGWGQRSATLTLQWTFSGVGTARETATVTIVAPASQQAGTEVAYACRPS
ncbi:hypothetical protein E1193_26055 [Micromonospora sp. KC606]|uniref:hypothetical protein n=1 Tax=Micromonospora sp. KC606 TaxID=2530379 RepID=UPI0010445919|nr:hypothetical protein [Micromonospora sp. KC606]TDC73197.1 hypothetical protein E1193_26055 [Micromonospora sp. KC606]